MPRYKLSPEERAAEKERKENLRNIMKGLDVKSFDDLKTYRNAKPSKSSQMRNLKNSKLKPSEHTPQAVGYISKQEPTS